MASILPLILILAVMYLLLIRPQQQRARRQREMVQSLDVGAEIQTIGGIIGRIVSLDDQNIRVEVAPGVIMTFVRAAVARVIEPPEPEPDEADAYGEEGYGAHGPDASYDGGPNGHGSPAGTSGPPAAPPPPGPHDPAADEPSLGRREDDEGGHA